MYFTLSIFAGILAIESILFASVQGIPLNKTTPRAGHSPVPISGLDPNGSAMQCDGVTVRASDQRHAIEWAVNLIINAEAVGDSSYPHTWRNMNSKSQPYFALSDKCINAGKNLQEFPVIDGGIYNGEEPYKFRVLFAYNPVGDDNPQRRPSAAYCGTIYYRGNGFFYGCDVKNA